ncbi:hypothetical protein WJX77_010170 [Trebouxia sp. C0004]
MTRGTHRAVMQAFIAALDIEKLSRLINAAWQMVLQDLMHNPKPLSVIHMDDMEMLRHTDYRSLGFPELFAEAWMDRVIEAWKLFLQNWLCLPVNRRCAPSTTDDRL